MKRKASIGLSRTSAWHLNRRRRVRGTRRTTGGLDVIKVVFWFDLVLPDASSLTGVAKSTTFFGRNSQR